MSEKEWRKLSALEHVVDGDWTMEMGASAARLSIRQFRRLRRAYEKTDDKFEVIIHGNTGRSPPNKLSERIRSEIIRLRNDTYEGFNDTHFTEKLVEVHNMSVTRQSVQRVLRGEKIASPQARKAKKRRKRRERRSKAGWLVLWDGSTHDWLEGRGPKMCLMGAIDDATGKILKGAHFIKHESSAGYLRLLYDMARNHGVPLEIYADKHSSLRRNDDHWTLEEQLAGRQEPPQVQRAAESFGIEIIWANSPQAKGRIERAWKTFQDRLISEFRLLNVTTIEEANRVLEHYRREHNRKFARQPKDRSSAWRMPVKGTALAEACSFHTTAVARKDSTVSYGGQMFDLKGPSTLPITGKLVQIRHLLNGQLKMYIDDNLVSFTKTAPPTKAPARRKRRVPSATKQKKKQLTFKEIREKHQTAA